MRPNDRRVAPLLSRPPRSCIQLVGRLPLCVRHSRPRAGKRHRHIRCAGLNIPHMPCSPLGAQRGGTPYARLPDGNLLAALHVKDTEHTPALYSTIFYLLEGRPPFRVSSLSPKVCALPDLPCLPFHALPCPSLTLARHPPSRQALYLGEVTRARKLGALCAAVHRRPCR